MSKDTTRVPKEFTSLKEATEAIGETRHIDYLATIAGQTDTRQRHAYAMTDFRFALEERKFGQHSRDSVMVWLRE